MSRTMFILGCALVAVAGSLVFVLNHHPADDSLRAAERVETAAGRVRGWNAGGGSSEGFAPAAPRASRRDNEESQPATVAIEPWRLEGLAPDDRARAAEIVGRIGRESRERLDRLDATYRLSPAQRDEIYPLVVAHHPLSHPALQVGGQAVPLVGEGASLEESIFPYLDEQQKQLAADEVMDQMSWWSEIIGQIEDDLDSSLDQSGAIAADGLIEEPATVDVGAGVGFDTGGAAAGDGEAASRQGGNLFDLLGQ